MPARPVVLLQRKLVDTVVEILSVVAVKEGPWSQRRQALGIRRRSGEGGNTDRQISPRVGRLRRGFLVQFFCGLSPAAGDERRDTDGCCDACC